MSRYVDADAYIEANACCGYLDEISVDKFNEITPTADVRENVHGEWVRHYDEDGDADGYSCSACREWYYFGNTTLNFCPNCGADMRGEKDGWIKTLSLLRK